MPMSETMQAAQIAAQATIRAGAIQGVSVLVAGLSAILAGWVAYCGAIKAAARQAQLEENKHQNRVAAYRNRLSGIVEHLDRCSYVADASAKMSLQQFRQHGGVVDPGSLALPLVPDLSPDRWENHALLGRQVCDAIPPVFEAMERYRLLHEEIAAGNLSAGNVPRFKSVKAVSAEDGRIDYMVVAELQEELARGMRLAILDLKDALVAPSR